MIPRTIHYCWFGGNELPELAKKCVESWKKYCPGYEIKEWNESNFDINCCDYVREAYEAKKWAFVSDYARFKILYENGGVYFDTDVELIKAIDDVVDKGSFMGAENQVDGESGKSIAIAPGLGIAAMPGLELYEKIIERYHKRHFVNEDGSYNTKTVVEYTSELLFEYGLKNQNEIQCVAGIFIYPKEFFCPLDYETGQMEITENTYSIHHYSASWHEAWEQYACFLGRKWKKVLPDRVATILAVFFAKTKNDGFLNCCGYVWKKAKRWIKKQN